MTHTQREVQRVLMVTLLLNLTVAAGKIVVGLLTGALAITADGFHSLMDGAANLVALIASRIAAQPPDADHPYGHRRYETVAAAGIGVLLLLTAYEVVSGAVERLFNPHTPTVSPVAAGVLGITLIVNLGVSRWERRAGRRLRSDLLLADAANTGADVFVTLAVLGSIGLTALGLPWADPLAALLIVGLIGRAAWDILRTSGGVLVDTAPYPPDELQALVEPLPAVDRVLRARSRGTADAAHIDIDVQVAPSLTVRELAAVAAHIRERVRTRCPGAEEIEVHFEPGEPRSAELVYSEVS